MRELKNNCSICSTTIRKPDKEMEYIGLVCSKCYRMSDKLYKQYVDIICKKRENIIIQELKEYFRKTLEDQ
jgi:Fe-S oxidoreductase